MSAVANLETLTSTAEFLLRAVTEEEEEVALLRERPELLSSSLETVRAVALSMTGPDSELASLTVRSIILKCLNVPEGGELERTKVLILCRLVQLHTDLTTSGEDLTNLVCSALQQSRVSTHSWLSVVCSLSNDIFLHHQDIMRQTFFWQQLQAGLVSADHLDRKRALYLAKRSVDILTGEGREEAELVELIGANKKAARERFEIYFLVLETLEEKQVHIVRQVSQKIEQLVRISSQEGNSSFNSSWSLILFMRLFQHPNMSMVGWGLQLFLQTRFDQKTLGDPNFLSFLCNPLLDVLNETKIYSRDLLSSSCSTQQTGETLAQLLAEFLTDCLIRQNCQAGAAVLIRTFLTALVSKSWAPIPLTWISFALKYFDLKNHSQSPGKYFTENEVSGVKVLVETGMQYQEPLLRAAAQSNFCLFVIDNVDPDQCTVEELASFLHTFVKKKVLFCSDSSDLWKKTANFVTETFLRNDFQTLFARTKERFENLRKLTSESNKVVMAAVDEFNLLLVLFIYHKNFDSKLISKMRHELFLKSEPTRVYEGDRFKYSNEEWSRVEHFHLISLFRLFEHPQRRGGKPFLHYIEEGKPEGSGGFFEIFGYSPGEIWSVARQVLESIEVLLNNDCEDVEIIVRSETYLALLISAADSLTKDYLDSCYLLEFLDRVLQALSSTSRVKKMIAMETLVTLTKLKVDPALTKSLIVKFQPYFGLESFTRSLLTENQRENDIQNREQQKVWGKLSGKFTARQLQILKFLIENKSFQVPCEVEHHAQMMELLIETIETGGKDCLVVCLDLAESMGSVSTGFLQAAKSFIFEFRKNEIFWPSLRLLFKVCLNTILASPESVIEILLTLIGESESAGGIFPLLMVEVLEFTQTVSPHSGLGELLVPVLGRALTYGPVYRKDQKLVTETNEAVFALGETCEANFVEGSDHLMDAAVRVNAINTILHLQRGLNQDEKSSFVFNLFKELQNINGEVTGKRVRHFENSNIHRVRQRIYQAQLLFCQLLNQNHRSLIIKELCETLLEHSEQTSVRYYCEWTVTTLLISSDQLSSAEICQWLQVAAQRKVGSVPSFILIVTQYLCHHKSVSVTELERGLRDLSPWCMAQNFYTRLVAQVCFRKVWFQCQTAAQDLVEKYSPLFECIARSVNPANGEKITEDFYITKFDPVGHLTLEDILGNFPRLCNKSEDEVISNTLLVSVPVCHIPLRNQNSVLASDSDENINKKKNSSDPMESQNIQKKITPWTSMISDADIGVSNRQSKDEARPHEDLVVVASLIDKSPNLGGLCRTSEILGVGSLVLPSLAVVKDKEFSAVSVTAENWIPLQECQSYKLSDFLQQKKKEGFTIVAVEQAAESVLLSNYVFPKKCVFLLGKEKEGVPVELLNQVDVCIEIPQYGLIRNDIHH